MKFTAIVEAAGKTATGIEVPADLVEKLGAGKRPPIRATINDYTYRTSIGVMGGRFLIPVSADVRKSAGVAAGNEVEVDVELDTSPRDVTVPADLAQAMDLDTRQFFDSLSYSRKQRFVLPIEKAKTHETRQRHIDKALIALRAGKPEP
jgi:hypothetical protein